jgi:hypothetical protein
MTIRESRVPIIIRFHSVATCRGDFDDCQSQRSIGELEARITFAAVP